MEFRYSTDGVDHHYFVQGEICVKPAPHKDYPGKWEVLARAIEEKSSEVALPAEEKLLILFRGSKKGAKVLCYLIKSWNGIPSTEILESMLAVSNIDE